MATLQNSIASHHHLYSQVRSTIQSGDLLAWRITKASGFFDFVLMLYQRIFKARFSHVAVALRVGDRVFAVEAVPNAVRIFPLSMLGNFYLIRAGVDDKPGLFTFLTRHLGKPYSVFDLVKSLVAIKGDDSKLYCSELALDFYESIGYFQIDIDEFDDRVPTPDDIVERVMAQAGAPIEFVRIDQGNMYAL